jgi:hypothetical protein
MSLSIKRFMATAASSMLAALLCLTAAHAQDAEESGAEVTAPIVQVAGTWTGTDTETSSNSPGEGPMTLVLTQDLKKIDGTFSLTTGNSTPAGPVRGKISNDVLKLTFVATSGSNHVCTAKVLATVDVSTTPATMSGTFLVMGGKRHCKGKGTFDLTEQ